MQLLPLTPDDVLALSSGALWFFADRIKNGLEFSVEDLELADRTARKYLAELRDAGVISVTHRRGGPIKITPLRTRELQEDAAAGRFIRTFRQTAAGEYYKNFDESDYSDLREKFPNLLDFDFHLRTALKSAHRAERRVPESSLVAYITPHLEKIYSKQETTGDTALPGKRTFDDPEEEARHRRDLARQQERIAEAERQKPQFGPFHGIDFSKYDPKKERLANRQNKADKNDEQ